MPTDQQLGIYVHGAPILDLKSPVHGGLIPKHGAPGAVGVGPIHGSNNNVNPFAPYAAYQTALDFKNSLYTSGSTQASSWAAFAAVPAVNGAYSRAGAKSELNATGTPVAFAANVPAIVPGVGYFARAALTNLIFPSAGLTTQNVTVTAQAYTLAFTGTGSVTLSGVATGTLTGTGAARVSLTFTPTAGVLTLTVTGTCNDAGLIAGNQPGPIIPTTTAAASTGADVMTLNQAFNPAPMTNLLLQSQALGTAPWGFGAGSAGGTGVAPTVTNNFAAAPDGTTTATRCQFNHGAGVTGADKSYFSQALTLSAANNTPSIWLKTNDASTHTLRVGPGFTSCTITGSWQRFTLPNIGAGATTFYLIHQGDIDATAAIDILAWQAQSVVGSVPGPIIPTTTATVTQSVSTDTDCVIYAVVNNKSTDTANHMPFSLEGPTDDERFMPYYTPTGTIFAFYKDAQNANTSTPSPALTLNAGRIVVAVRRRAGKFTLAGKNGSGTVAVGTEDAASQFPNLQQIGVGYWLFGSAYWVNDAIEFIGIKYGTFSDAQLTTDLTNL